MSDQDYAGDVNVEQAWSMLSDNVDVVLVDCRTTAEWSFVGAPDLSQIGKNVVFVEWLRFPTMELNPAFVGELKSQGVTPDKTVLFICRSGQRSQSAAIAATAHGYNGCFNVSGGFEGPSDESQHRGTVDGWKAKGLPWIQK